MDYEHNNKALNNLPNGMKYLKREEMKMAFKERTHSLYGTPHQTRLIFSLLLFITFYTTHSSLCESVRANI